MGDVYKICSIERPIYFNLNKRFKQLIELYKKREVESGFLQKLTFQVVLHNAVIDYF